MKHNLGRKIICSLLICVLLIGYVNCAALGKTADEVNTFIGGIVSSEGTKKGVSGKQGLVDYYSENEMTLGGEWYVLSFIRNNDKLSLDNYENKLIDYLKNNTVYSATTREKFALMFLAMGTEDRWAKNYVEETADEAIGKQGIMSLVFGLHLLNNGCKNSEYTPYSLAQKLISMQNDDGGWANSGSVSDVDVTAMTLESLYPFYSSFKSEMDEAVNLLSERQNEDGTFQSYGVNNAESTCQVIIALCSLNIDPDSDSRFIKNSNSAFDGLLKFKKSDGSFSHVLGGDSNNSATSQALNAFVAYKCFVNRFGAFYSLQPYNRAQNETVTEKTTSSSQKPEKTTAQRTTDSQSQENITSVSSYAGQTEITSVPGNEEQTQTAFENESNGNGNTTDFSDSSQQSESFSEKEQNRASDELITFENGEAIASISLTREGKIKLIIAGVILALAVLVSVVFFALKKRNYKNFIVIFAAALIAVVSLFFIKISAADDYYNSSVVKTDTVGVVSIEVRCDTVSGRENAPEDPIILPKTEIEINENDTVYNVLSQALMQAGIPFEHNASYYISGIDNLYEFEFGDLSGWMYLVNGKTPSVGCGEYVLSDGDEIQWMYTCDIGNDLKEYEKN